MRVKVAVVVRIATSASSATLSLEIARNAEMQQLCIMEIASHKKRATGDPLDLLFKELADMVFTVPAETMKRRCHSG